MRILFLSRWFPYPPHNGSKLRVYHLLRGLVTAHEVTLVSFFEQGDIFSDSLEIKTLREVHLVPWKPFNPSSIRSRLGYLNPKPRSMIDSFSPQMSQTIQKILHAEDYDLVIASQIGTAAYSREFRGLPALFEELEIGLLYEHSEDSISAIQGLRNKLTWLKHQSYLKHLIRDFCACTVVSNHEKHILKHAIPNYHNIHIIPNCIHLDDYQEIPHQLAPSSLIFTGSFRYRPNYEAMVWFVGDVLPHIQQSLPDMRLIITGDHAGLPLPKAKNVILTGFVNDVRPLVAGSLVSLAPLLSGGGTRLKILEAMALGTPVVATTKGAQGLDVEDGENILIADTAGRFAEAVQSVVTNPGIRQRMVTNAHQLVREKYNWDVVLPYFLKLVEKLVAA